MQNKYRKIGENIENPDTLNKLLFHVHKPLDLLLPQQILKKLNDEKDSLNAEPPPVTVAIALDIFNKIVLHV